MAIDSESETVEERARAEWGVDNHEALKALMPQLPDGSIELTDALAAAMDEAAILFAAKFASSLLQEKERERNALVTLLRAKCSDSEWAGMCEKFNGLTRSK